MKYFLKDYKLILIILIILFLAALFNGINHNSLNDLLSMNKENSQQFLPEVFLLDPHSLLNVKQAVCASGESYKHPLKRLCDEADLCLKSGPYSVINKRIIPPSGDKHDYMSMAPYWWPNPNTSNGLPYIRRDGEVNPERQQYDKIPGAEMAENVYTLAIAFYFTGNPEYSKHAAKLLKVWFIHEETRMNPNLNYGQFIPGLNKGRNAGIIETRNFYKVVEAVGLLAGSEYWKEVDTAALQDWFRSYLDWLIESKLGKKESGKENNHGTWYDIQVATFAAFVGEIETVKDVLSTFPERRIATQIEPDGRQPNELKRTKAFHYSMMNLDGHFKAATLAEKIGLDIWNYSTEDGRSIRKALDFLIPYGIGEKEWAYQQITGWQGPNELFFSLLLRAADVYHDEKYEETANSLPYIEVESDIANLLY